MNRIKRNIMRRVYIIYTVRALGGMQTVRALAMATCVFGLLQFVSIVDVITNASRIGSLRGFGEFMYSAVANTEIWTLVALGVFLLAGISFVRTFGAVRAPQWAS